MLLYNYSMNNEKYLLNTGIGGLSIFFAMGSKKPTFWGFDGPCLRITFSYFTFCIGKIDLENLLRSSWSVMATNEELKRERDELLVFADGLKCKITELKKWKSDSEASYIREIDSMRKFNETNIYNINTSYIKEIEKMKSEFSTELNLLNAKNESEIKIMKDSYLQEKRHFKAQIEEQENDIDERDDEITELTKELKEEIAQKDRLETEIADIKSKLEDVKNLNHNYVDDNAFLQEELTTSNTFIEKIQKELASIERELEYLYDEYMKKVKFISELEKQIEYLDGGE